MRRLFLALLCDTSQLSYCHGVGVRRLPVSVILTVLMLMAVDYLGF